MDLLSSLDLRYMYALETEVVGSEYPGRRVSRSSAGVYFPSSLSFIYPELQVLYCHFQTVRLRRACQNNTNLGPVL